MLAFPAYAAAAGQSADKPLDAEVASVEVRGIGKQTATNYTVPTSSVATGIRLTQRETPQSLSVITEKQIDENVELSALPKLSAVYERMLAELLV